MDHVTRLQPITSGDLGLAGRAAAERAALGQKLRSGGTVNGAVDATAAQKAFVRGIDDGIDVEACDVAFDDVDAWHGLTSNGLYQYLTGPVSRWTKPERG